MKVNMMIIAMLYCNMARTQPHVGVEQYLYWGNTNASSLVTMAYLQNNNNWYAEVRHNYEEPGTFSLHVGKTFTKTAALTYSVTPVIGGLAGKFNGGSLGVNLDMDYRYLSLAVQWQYTFSAQDKIANFMYSWSELGCQTTGWLTAGLAFQQTRQFRSQGKIEPGGFAAFSFRKLTVPIYVFSPLTKSMYYVLGINWEYQYMRYGNRNKLSVL